MERLFELGSFTWSTTSTITPAPFQSFYPFSLLYAQPIITEILSYYTYIKCDMELQFRMQTTQFYQGSLMFTAVPFDFTFNNPLNSSVYARSWQRPIVLSAQCEDSVVIKLPWLRPTRFERPVDLDDPLGSFQPWSVMVDILTPLRVASSGAPDSVSVQITGRFINPHLIWPVPPPSSLKKLAPVKQSGKTTERIAPARGTAQKVHVPKSASHPVDEAKSVIGTQSTTAAGTVVSTIAGVSDSIMSVLDSISPLAELAGLFLDKPQMPDESARMFIAPATNFVASDVRDQAYSLSLYKTAYLGTASNTLPESSDVSWLAIAMRPALQFTDYIGNSSPNNIRDHASHPVTTPFGWAISSHLLWRGSIRYHINFYASTFVSGRILIVYSPPTSSAVTTINNTISKLVSIKGDTTVEFTIPFVSKTDFQTLGNPNISGDFYGTGVLTFSVYGTITSSDSSTDALIDFAAWSAAAPDAQFVQPLCSDQYQLAPVAFEVRKQADIVQAFSKTFPPYVDGCEYLTDTGYVAAEISRSPMDVLKRYQIFGANLATNSPLPGNYVPQSGTIGAQIRTAFLFQRGGVNYKVFPNLPTATDYVDPANVAAAKWTVDPTWQFYNGNFNNNNASGLPYLTVGQSDSEIDLSVPYTNIYPFIYTIPSVNPSNVPSQLIVTPRSNPNSWDAGPPISPVYITGMDVYTCVRDDYMMGWLLAPTPLAAASGQPLKSAPKADSPSSSAPYSADTQPQSKQLLMTDFLTT